MPEGRARDKHGQFVSTKVEEETSGDEPATPQRKRRVVVVRPAQPLKPSQCRDWLRKTVAAAFPDVVEGFLNEAVKGGCAHLKVASDTLATKAPVPENKPKGKGPAQLLLEELDREMGLD